MNQLPPGQHETSVFHRFGLTPFATRFPRETAVPKLTVSGAVSKEVCLVDPLRGLPRVEQLSDFHCVTTWSVRSLRWEGVRFRDFYRDVIMLEVSPAEHATLVALKGQDGARTGMLLEDLLAQDVLLADRLNGEALSVRHGAPLRLVAPAHYGYKSVKYLCSMEFGHPDQGYRVSGLRFMDHTRARVALEERGRGIPGIFLRLLYRPLIRGTASRFARSYARWKQEHGG